MEILPGKEGLLHVSEISQERVEKVEDVLKVGDVFDVKVISTDNGKISLSKKECNSYLMIRKLKELWKLFEEV